MVFTLNCLKMKQTKLTDEDLKWIKENPKEFTDELIRKSELIKNFSNQLEPYRIKKDRKGYNKLFKELLKKEEEKLWKKELQNNN
jgi:hypothetical protein